MSLAERRYRDAVRVLASLEAGGFQARLAGGCVRDRMLGVEPADYDVATTARPEAAVQHFAGVGLRTVPTGIAHGTITVLAPAGPVEVTTLRVDVATDGRHAQVAFGESFAADAERRDFTINAMFEDARGAIYDYVGGVADLKAKTLRFVGDAAARIREDYLRILRLYRFWARFGFAPAPGTREAIAATCAGLPRVSQERITGELLRLFAAEHAHAPLEDMTEVGVWPLVMPCLPMTRAHVPAPDMLRQWRTAAAPVRGLAVLAGLLLGQPDKPGEGLTREHATEVGRRLKLSNSETQTLAYLPAAVAVLAAPPPAEPAAALDFIDACAAAAGEDALTRFYAPVFGAYPALAPTLQAVTLFERRFEHRRKAKLPLDGNRLADHFALAPGPELGVILAKLKTSFRNGAWSTAEEGLAWVEATLKVPRKTS